MTAPTQQAAPTALSDLSEDPSVRDAIAALSPARVSLVAAGDNPNPGRRARFDTWGDEPDVYVGVPDGASREALIEVLWQLRLLGAGWPDPTDPNLPERARRLSMWLLAGAARTWAGDERDADGAREQMRDLIVRLDEPDAALELFCAAGAFEDDERAQILERVGALNAPLAAQVDEMLDQAGRLPLTPAEAADAIAWLLGEG